MKWNIFFTHSLTNMSLLQAYLVLCRRSSEAEGSAASDRFWNSVLLLLGYCLPYSDTLKSYLGSVQKIKLAENLSRIAPMIPMISTMNSFVRSRFYKTFILVVIQTNIAQAFLNFSPILHLLDKEIDNRSRTNRFRQESFDLDVRILTFFTNSTCLSSQEEKQSFALWYFFNKKIDFASLLWIFELHCAVIWHIEFRHSNKMV